MDTSRVEFRPSLLSGNQKGFAAALTCDEYDQRRRLVTEAALTQLGSTTSAYSNYHSVGPRHHMRDITCDAEGPRREIRPLLYALIPVIAVCGVVAAAASPFLFNFDGFQGVGRFGLPVGQVLPRWHVVPLECEVRETIMQLSDQPPTPSQGLERLEPAAAIIVGEFAEDTQDVASARIKATQSHDPQLKTVSGAPVSAPKQTDVDLVEGGEDQDETSDLALPAAPPEPPSIRQAELCTCPTSAPMSVCLTTALINTICAPVQPKQPPPRAPASPRKTAPPKPQPPTPTPTRPPAPAPLQATQRHKQQQDISPEDTLPQSEPRIAVPTTDRHPPAPAPPGPTLLPPSFQPNTPPPSPPLMRTPLNAVLATTLANSHSASTTQVLARLEALLASRSLPDFATQLRSTAAQPHGALVMWIAVVTPLLSVFGICFTLTQALRLAWAVLAAMSNVCSASSHFSLQRLGALARRLIPSTPSSSEEVMLLELQAAMSQREADCRAKDEQLASLRQLLDGLQLELQRCSDAEKDLRCKYRKLVESTEAKNRMGSTRADRSPSRTSTRSSLIPGPAALEQMAPLSAPSSVFSDGGSESGTLARLRASPPTATTATASPPTDTPSAVPAPPRLGRVGASSSCAARSAVAQGFADVAVTPLLTEAPSPSSDHSEAAFATCTAEPPHSATAALR
eukprot:jgi/Ulvmu1/2559/UM014_0010.1